MMAGHEKWATSGSHVRNIKSVHPFYTDLHDQERKCGFVLVFLHI